MGRQSEESMRVGLEDIGVTSCLNVCIVVILLTSPPLDPAARDEEGGGPALPSSRRKKLTKIN